MRLNPVTGKWEEVHDVFRHPHPREACGRCFHVARLHYVEDKDWWNGKPGLWLCDQCDRAKDESFED